MYYHVIEYSPIYIRVLYDYKSIIPLTDSGSVQVTLVFTFGSHTYVEYYDSDIKNNNFFHKM